MAPENVSCPALDCLLEDLRICSIFGSFYEKRGPKVILYFRLKNRKTRKNSFKKLEVKLQNPSLNPTNPLMKRKYGIESLDQDEKNLDEEFKIRYNTVYSQSNRAG